MIKKLSESSGPIVGYNVVGKVTADDYRLLEPEIQSLADEYDHVRMLIDLQEFAGEEARAWLPDLRFGHRFHNKISRMAIVGDKRWQEWLTALADPFYAEEARFFRAEEINKAWAWLRDDAK